MKKTLLLLLYCSMWWAASPQTVPAAHPQAPADSLTERLFIDQPLLDLPYLRHAAASAGNVAALHLNPSMGVATTLSIDFYTAAHWGLLQIPYSPKPEHRQRYARLAIYGFDLLSSWLPLGYAWLHEEYHRSVMTLRGIASFNEVYLFPVGKNTISVSRIADQDLIRLCNQFPADFARLMAAGHEGQTIHTQQLQRNQFFYHQQLHNELLYLNNAINNTAYLALCAFGWADKTTAQMNQRETDIASRDFTGMDMMAWAHKLFNPDLPYEARGTHPSGIGINRYITYDQLSPQARNYLKRQTALDLLNSVSPMMIGISHISLGAKNGRRFIGNFSLRHFLTSFGDDNCAELLLQVLSEHCSYPLNGYLTLHNYNNYSHHYIGLELGACDLPLFGGRLLAGVCCQMWRQPQNLDFFTNAGEWGGSASLRLRANLRRHPEEGESLCSPYIAAGWKSQGWVAGTVFQEQTFYAEAGLRWKLGI